MPEPEDQTSAEQFEADVYELLSEADVDDDPPPYRPLGPGDVFDPVALEHLATPVTGPVIVVGHPCSLRRGLTLQDDIPVAPIVTPGIKTDQQMLAERLFPVGTLLPPGATARGSVKLVSTTTVPAANLNIERRCARLGDLGVVALQQRVIGNQGRVKVPPSVLSRHMRGPLTELELWTDWRECCVEAGLAADALDEEFDALMNEPAGEKDGLSWRRALAEQEFARARVVPVMTSRVKKLVVAS